MVMADTRIRLLVSMSEEGLGAVHDPVSVAPVGVQGIQAIVRA
jgi:hypothetical protein